MRLPFLGMGLFLLWIHSCIQHLAGRLIIGRNGHFHAFLTCDLETAELHRSSGHKDQRGVHEDPVCSVGSSVGVGTAVGVAGAVIHVSGTGIRTVTGAAQPARSNVLRAVMMRFISQIHPLHSYRAIICQVLTYSERLGNVRRRHVKIVRKTFARH